jgi:hypothetical protein
MPKSKRKPAITKTPHLWIDGPDGSRYHCVVCGISKCEDHANWDTCESWIIERAKRVETNGYDTAALSLDFQRFLNKVPPPTKRWRVRHSIAGMSPGEIIPLVTIIYAHNVSKISHIELMVDGKVIIVEGDIDRITHSK